MSTPKVQRISSMITPKANGVRTALDEMSKDGAFKRKDSAWRNWISRENDAEFPPEKDRYHLYLADACPWAHRCLMVRAMKGLEDTISVTSVHPVWKKTRPDDKDDKHCGWAFGDPNSKPFYNTSGTGGPFPGAFPSTEPEPHFNCKSIRDLYEKAGDSDGKYTVPILWDKLKSSIVSNESSEIIRMLNSEFNDFATNPDLDLEPQNMKEEMDKVDKWIYPTINNGVYRCGFATTQESYDIAIEQLTDSFDKIEQILSKQRYIAGDKVTLSDVRLFVTLLRFDEVYVVYFKTNTRSVVTSPSILNYCREIYQMPGVKETIYMDLIKMHYFASHPTLNHYSIIPRGYNFISQLEKPHDR